MLHDNYFWSDAIFYQKISIVSACLILFEGLRLAGHARSPSAKGRAFSVGLTCFHFIVSQASELPSWSRSTWSTAWSPVQSLLILLPRPEATSRPSSPARSTPTTTSSTSVSLICHLVFLLRYTEVPITRTSGIIRAFRLKLSFARAYMSLGLYSLCYQ